MWDLHPAFAKIKETVKETSIFLINLLQTGKFWKQTEYARGQSKRQLKLFFYFISLFTENIILWSEDSVKEEYGGLSAPTHLFLKPLLGRTIVL